MNQKTETLEHLLALSTMTLATYGSDGSPHAAPVYFSGGENMRLYFFSSPDSQHGRDVVVNPKAAAAIYPQGYDWQDIHGLQLHGEVTKIPAGQEWEHACDTFVAKFPFVENLKMVFDTNQFYVFASNWVRLVDNRQGFGFKQEWTLS